MTENELAALVFQLGLKIHKRTGPGLLESAYEHCLDYEFCRLNLKVRRQAAIPMIYENTKLDAGYRADFIVEEKLIIEVKAVEALNDIHAAQLLTYLKLSGCKLGLLINFNTVFFAHGVKRIINGWL